MEKGYTSYGVDVEVMMSVIGAQDEGVGKEGKGSG